MKKINYESVVNYLKITGSVIPQQINIVQIENVAKIRLTKNCQEKVIENEFNELGNRIEYEYDEVVFEIPYRENITNDIQSNFEIWFVFGEQFMQKTEQIKQATLELEKLIAGKELPEVNKILAQELIEREIENIVLGQQLIDIELRLIETYRNSEIKMDSLQAKTLSDMRFHELCIDTYEGCLNRKVELEKEIQGYVRTCFP